MPPKPTALTLVLILSLPFLGGGSDVRAQTAGVDIAAPRVAMTNADGATLKFVPANLAVEQGDYVQWNWVSGTHNTISGANCVSSGLWSAPLDGVSGVTFLRAFNEAPSTIPFYCSFHCTVFNMKGQVVVTTPISLTVTDLSGASQLDWSGGGGLYRVFRSTSPLFGSGTAVLTSAGGTASLSFLDTTAGTPAVGTAFFYLVMNQF